MERPTLRQLEYLVAAAEQPSVRKAAGSCFVSQPALSAQFAQMLARGLGVTLLPEPAVERKATAAPGLRAVPFGGDGPSRSIGLAWRTDSPRADEYRALGELLASAYADA